MELGGPLPPRHPTSELGEADGVHGLAGALRGDLGRGQGGGPGPAEAPNAPFWHFRIAGLQKWQLKVHVCMVTMVAMVAMVAMVSPRF